MKSMRNRRGFTFIEMLLAIAIFSFIATGLYGALRSGYKLWNRSDENSRTHQNWRSFDIHVTRDLRNALDYSEDLPFEASDKKMSYMTLVADYRGGHAGSRLTRVIYEVDDADNVLLRKVADVSAGFDEKFARAARLADLEGNLKGLRFDYCYYDESSEDCEWIPEWEAKQPPKLIRIQGASWKKVIFVPLGTYGVRDE